MMVVSGMEEVHGRNRGQKERGWVFHMPMMTEGKRKEKAG